MSRQKQQLSPQQLSDILEDSITSLLKSTPSDPIAFLADYFKHEQQPDSPSNAHFQLSQVPFNNSNFSHTCFQVFSKYRDFILDHSGAKRDLFLSELYAKICSVVPKEIANILTSKLQLTPPTDFKSFERAITACYTYNLYLTNSDSLYSLLLTENNTPPQERMLESLDILKGDIVSLTQIGEADRLKLVGCIQELVLRDAGAGVGRREFVGMLALMFVHTLQ